MKSSQTETPAVSQDRIRESLERIGIGPLLTPLGDTAMYFWPNLIHIAVQDNGPYLGFCRAVQQVDAQFTDKADELVVSINSTLFTPKIYTEVSDEGQVTFTISHRFNWDEGATDKQIDLELDAFIHGAAKALNQIDRAFPSPWKGE